LTGCRDYARIDFRLKDEIPYVIEVNPNPGINIDSGFFRSAKTARFTYDGMIHKILEVAKKRYHIEPISSAKKSDVNYSTEHLFGRNIKVNDLDILLKWFNDPEISKYMEAPDSTDSKESLIQNFFLSSQKDVSLVIYEKESNLAIGYCSIYNIRRFNQSAEISFLIGEKEFQGRGYSKEIVSLLLSIAFDEMKLNSVVATATQDNIRSVQLLKKIGFREVGVLSQYHIINGLKNDDILFEITKDEYLRSNAIVKAGQRVVSQ